jgi:hypothetical protein
MDKEMSLRIRFPGRYRLTAPWVGLAGEPARFFEAGDAFTVTRVIDEDSVIYVPEFGGWTFYEVPARPAGWVTYRYLARRLIPYVGCGVGIAGFAAYGFKGSDLHQAAQVGFFVASLLYTLAVAIGNPVPRMFRRKQSAQDV